MNNNNTRRLSSLRTVALIAIFIGAIGSIWLTLYTGRRNSSILLMTLFVIWVLSPFFLLYVADRISKFWHMATRVTIYLLMIFVPVLSLVAYSGVLHGRDTKPAFMFLIIPLISWILIAIGITVAAQLSRRKSI